MWPYRPLLRGHECHDFRRYLLGHHNIIFSSSQIYVGVGKKILDFEAFSPDGNINPAVGPEPLTQDP